MVSLDTIQQDIEALPPEARQIVFDLVQILKQRYHPTALEPSSDRGPDDWSDFMGCMEAEPDLSTHYKTYLGNALDKK